MDGPQTSIAIQGLAGNDPEVSFRPLVSIPDIATIEADHQFLAGLDGAPLKDLRLSPKPPSHVHRSVSNHAGGCFRRQRKKFAEKIGGFAKRQQSLANPQQQIVTAQVKRTLER